MIFMSHGMKIIQQEAIAARDVMIDPFIPADDAAALFKQWKQEWGELFQFQGGTHSASCSMVAAIPLTELTKAFGVKRGRRIYNAAVENSII